MIVRGRCAACSPTAIEGRGPGCRGGERLALRSLQPPWTSETCRRSGHCFPTQSHVDVRRHSPPTAPARAPSRPTPSTPTVCSAGGDQPRLGGDRLDSRRDAEHPRVGRCPRRRARRRGTTLSTTISVPGPRALEREREVVGAALLVGVDEDEVERPRHARQRLERRARRRSRPRRRHPRAVEVRAGHRGVVRVDLERHEPPVRRQRPREPDRL